MHFRLSMFFVDFPNFLSACLCCACVVFVFFYTDLFFRGDCPQTTYSLLFFHQTSTIFHIHYILLLLLIFLPVLLTHSFDINVWKGRLQKRFCIPNSLGVKQLKNRGRYPRYLRTHFRTMFFFGGETAQFRSIFPPSFLFI